MHTYLSNGNVCFSYLFGGGWAVENILMEKVELSSWVDIRQHTIINWKLFFCKTSLAYFIFRNVKNNCHKQLFTFA